jgi:transcriptional regulator with PAS, ATPase and Fis domain
MIHSALRRLDGNKSAAAKALGISRSSLIAKVQEYGLEQPDDAPEA